MMAYQSGFVVAIVTKDGKVIREQNTENERTVRLPFGSEYSVRVWNKNNVRAYAKVLIDGTEVLEGRLVLSPNQKVDVERFVLDGDLDKGKRFKFVSAGHGDVQDPTAKENGEIEVIFEKEIECTLTRTTTYPAGGLSVSSGVLRGVSFDAIGTTAVNTAYVNSSGPSSNSVVIPQSDTGATIEGGESSQKFQNVSTYFMTEPPISIKVRIRGPKVTPTEPQVFEKPSKLISTPQGLFFSIRGQPLAVDGAEFTATHMVIKVPLNQVSLG